MTLEQEGHWDYRYAWLRDCADAGIALSHAEVIPRPKGWPGRSAGCWESALTHPLRPAGEPGRVDSCPDALLRCIRELADAALRRWQLPDHGIWELRGASQDYVHSKVTAWSALRTASELTARGRIEGPAATWLAESGAIQGAVTRRGQGAGGELVMSFQEPAADSSSARGLPGLIH